MYKFGTRTKKVYISLSVLFFLLVQILGVFTPQPVLAQGDAAITSLTSALYAEGKIQEGLLSASLAALVNGFSYFMRKLAYDTATYIASGGKGQGALAFNKGAGAYFSEVALDSAASAIEQFGSPLGLNLCKPPDLKFQIFLQVGIRRLYADPSAGGPTPKCSWKDFKENWDKGLENFDEKAGDFASQAFVRSLKVDQSDFGVAFGLIAQVDRINANAKEGAKTSREEGGGYKAVTDLISGDIKTPADVIREETKALTGKNQADLSSQQIAGIYGAGLWQVIPAAAGVFVNTLVSQVMQTIMTEGILPDRSSSGAAATENAVSSAFSEYAGVINNNKAAAQNAFNFLFSAVPTQELNTYPLMEEMGDCSNPDNPGLNNCVADPGMVQAVKQAKSGKALTIREAIDADLLHGNWSLVPPAHEYNANARKCYNDNYYCYSNIQKLRRARILPLGFEIAAAKSDPDQLQNWTLDKVVNGFYDCDKSGQPSAQHPFCHLIDPDWIIRLPEPRCDAKVFGPKLLAAGNAARREECVGISTCLAEDEKGKCLGDYGYCLREKNTWRFGGSTCPEQFNTCTSYTNTTNNARVSYLSRTVEFGQCNAQSVGCRVYSTEPKQDGTWRSTGQPVNKNTEISTGQNPAIYFNDSIKNYTCPASAEGCSVLSRVVPVSGERLTYLKKAPATLFDSCYLITDHLANTQKWPDNDGDIAELLKRPVNNTENGLCKPFAPACTKDEVGCEAYKPVMGGDTVTGIVGANQCPAQCIGYDTFKQEVPVDKGAFEPTVFPLHFIPSLARTCLPQYEGCSEFTNIDEAGAGGERLEYYSDLQYCEKPTNTNQKTFYSWEGSASLGYVLQTYKLRPISSDKNDRYNTNYLVYLKAFDQTPSYAGILAEFSAGSPAYVDDSQSVILANYNACNKTSYTEALKNPYVQGAPKPDCRALYDESGKVYYRLLSKTLTVSPACHPLRKTESILRVDPVLTQQNQEYMCTAKGGKWTGGTDQKCELCYNGGIYNNGACIYWTTSQPGGGAGENHSCVPQANNCRAYTGPAANNTQPVLTEKFEPEDSSPTALNDLLVNWSPGLLVKPESLTVGQNSLEINISNAEYTFATSTLETDKFYELEFWARGVQQNLEISFVQKALNSDFEETVGNFTYDPATDQTTKVPISPTWQSYRVGPVQFTGDGEHKIVLRFSRTPVGASGAYYLDNLRLTKVQDKLFLIKNSWKQVLDVNGNTVMADVPAECDANPTDGLPGSALGCRDYTDSLNNSVPLTGFDKLCRQDAVGCTAFYDLHNTINEREVLAYNLWCTAAQNTECTLKVGSTELGVCDVPAGEEGCFIPKVALEPANYQALIIAPASNAIVKSTIIIPADTATTTPIYLSYRQQYACDATNLGCQKIALEDHIIPNSTATSAYKFTPSYIKNNPENYEQILCAQEQLGCSAFKSNNIINYFKDPQTSGAPTCVYKEKSKAVNFSGWFQENVGKCSAVDPTKIGSGNLCKESTDCETGESCTGVGTVPCYPNYLIGGGEYGMWSNKSTNYNGAVGRCAEQYNQCTELIDPFDTAHSPSTPLGVNSQTGKPYYIIFNQKLLQDAGECQGKVNLKQGCALFNATNNPTMSFNAAETYKISDGLNAQGTDKYGPVDPVLTGTLDSNVLLKVNRDRTCSEWLGCKDKVRVTDANGKQRTICTQYKACRATEPGSSCTEWSPITSDDTNRLTETAYVTRKVAWNSEDYSGYSLFNKYKIGNTISVVFEGDAVAYLAFLFNPAVLGNDQKLIDEYSCKGKSNWDKCGFDDFGGRCYEKKCLYPLSGSFPVDVTTEEAAKKFLEAGSCKAFPEQTSPYPSSIVKNPEEGKRVPAFGDSSDPKFTRFESRGNLPGFEGANTCQDGECSCEYKKITYKNAVVDYRAAGVTEKPEGVCSVGDKAGQACEKDEHCNSAGAVVVPGVCSKVRDVETHTGLRGFCLERDFSRLVNPTTNEYACLTWLPTDTAATNFDQYNKFPEAGYFPALDAVKVDAQNNKVGEFGKVYCTEASGNGLGVIDGTIYTFYGTTPKWDSWVKTINTNNFSKNKMAYPFNTFGDYIGDFMLNYDSPPPPTVYPSHFKFEDKNTWENQVFSPNGYFLPFRPKDVSFQLNLNNGSVQGDVVEDYEYPKRLYSMMQMWAWAGGMYENGLAEKLPSGINLFTQKSLVEESQEPFSVRYPNAVVLFTSSLFYQNYLFTSQAKFELKSGFSPDKQQNFNESYNRFLYSNFYSNKYNGLNYFAGATLYENEIKALHFGPILAPQDMKTRVLTIDFDKLRTTNKDFSKSDTTESGITYDYTFYYAGFKDNRSGYFVFKVKPTSGSSKYIGKTRYSIVALSSNLNTGISSDAEKADILDINNPLPFFKEWIEELAGQSEGTNWQKYLKWRNDSRSLLRIYGTFDENGKKINFASDAMYSPVSSLLFNNGLDNNEMKSLFGDKSINGIYKFATPYLAEVVELKPRCTQFVQVYSEPDLLTGITNKAWTNRVWEQALPDIKYYESKPNIPFTRNVDLPPFGSTKFSSLTTLPTTWKDDLRKYIFVDPVADGIFLGCFGEALDKKTIYQEFAKVLFSADWTENLCDKNTSVPIYKQIAIAHGEVYLSELFAKTFKKLEYKDKKWEGESSVGTDSTGINTFSFKGKPPQLYSLNTTRCFSSDSNQKCTAAEKDALTINRRNGTADEDKDPKDSFPDPLIGQGSLTAVANFFGFADHNRMPIKRVMINWGDGNITNQNQYGEYKNKKPFCLQDDTDPNPEMGECSSSLLTCLVDNDCPSPDKCTSNGHNFGNSTRACEASYFEYVHGYSCSQADSDIDAEYVYKFNEINNGQGTDINPKIWDALKKQGFNALNNPFVCIFKPKVQILDNWGWCTGKCAGTPPGTKDYKNGCYKDGVTDYCNYDSEDSYIPFKGNIIVVP